MRKKRKGSETDPCSDLQEFLSSTNNSRSSVPTSHYSLEDYTRLKKRCKEVSNEEPVASCKSRLAGIATAPPSGTSSLVTAGRGLKRKIGCIDVATQMVGRIRLRRTIYLGPQSAMGNSVRFGCVSLGLVEQNLHVRL